MVKISCANTYAVAELVDYFSPIQLGVGVSGSCKDAVQATRRFAKHMPDDQVIVKQDFTNVFNSLYCDAMLGAMSPPSQPSTNFATLPTINRRFSHSSNIALCLQKALNKATLSKFDVLQHYPPLLRCMNSNLVEGYMDDIMLGGKSDIVAEDVSTICTLGSTLGLHLNANSFSAAQPPLSLPFSTS